MNLTDERMFMPLPAEACHPHKPAGLYIVMIDFVSLIESGVTDFNVTLHFGEFLKICDYVVQKTVAAMPMAVTASAAENLLSKKQVMEKFNVCETTLWNWRKNKYLEAVKVGRKVFYRYVDVQKALETHGNKK